MALDDLINIADATAKNPALEQISNLFEQIMQIPEDSLNEQNIPVMEGMLNGSFTDGIKENAITSMIEGFRTSNLTKSQIRQGIDELKREINQLVIDLKPSEAKQKLLDVCVKNIEGIFDIATERYQAYDVLLPIKLDTNAILPSYAHETDAAADLYANEDVTLPSHSMGTKITTGVHLGLPDGWAAYVVPRSSTGAKTPLRQSNCFGVIDSHYRGDISLLFDNIGDIPYEIHKGDRLAQMFIMPVYHFKAQVVEQLEETDRGEGGFGSTGA